MRSPSQISSNDVAIACDDGLMDVGPMDVGLMMDIGPEAVGSMHRVGQNGWPTDYGK